MTALQLWLASIGFAGVLGMHLYKWEGLAMVAAAAFGFLALAILKVAR